MGSFLLIVVKLSSYKGSNKYCDVGNLHKFKYVYDCFRHSCNA